MPIATEHAFKEKSALFLSDPITFRHFNVRHPAVTEFCVQVGDLSQKWL